MLTSKFHSRQPFPQPHTILPLRYSGRNAAGWSGTPRRTFGARRLSLVRRLRAASNASARRAVSSRRLRRLARTLGTARRRNRAPSDAARRLGRTRRTGNRSSGRGVPEPAKREFLTGVAVDYVEDVPAVKIWTSDAAPSSAIGQGYVEYVESVALRDGELITTKKFLCWKITPRPFYAVQHSYMAPTHPTAKALTALGTPTRATAVAGYLDVKTAAVVADAELLR